MSGVRVGDNSGDLSYLPDTDPARDLTELVHDWWLHVRDAHVGVASEHVEI